MTPGTLIADRFEVTALAGEGGMGTVYRAIDRDDGAEVAIKIAHSAGRSSRERFRREVAALERVAHPAIVGVRQAGAHAGSPYLVMDWIEGGSLRRRLAEGSLSVADTIALGARLAAGLAAAHDQGVVHRDLKPANVLLPGGDASRAVLVDFGVALAPTDHLPRVTASGALVGTLCYMSPEQARGRRDVGAASDLYSLGVLLHECLTGRRLVAADDAAMTMLHILMSDAPPALSLDEPTPRALSALLAHLLHKEPSARPRDAQSVRALLASIRPGTADARHPEARTVTQAPGADRRPVRSSKRRVERPELLAALEAAFDDGARVVTLIGPTGVGKSELARAMIERHPERESVWAELSGLASSDTLAAVAMALGVGEPEHVPAALSFRGDLLLVLDGADERAAQLAPSLEAWSAAAPRARLLSCSRHALGADGEALLEVSPLRVPDISRGELESPATELFMARAAEAVVGWTLSPASRRKVAEIVRRLDGLPLAIELVAAELEIMDLTELRARVEPQPDGSPMPEGAAARALQAAVQGSFAALDPIEALAVTQCAVFEGPFTYRAARETVSLPADNDVSIGDVLSRLRRKSWVASRRDDETRVRFQMYEPLRSFARRRLQGERRAAAEDRLANHLATWATKKLAEVELAGDVAAGRAILGATPDLLAMARRALDDGGELARWRALSALATLRCGAGAIGWPAQLDSLLSDLLTHESPPLIAGAAHHLRGLIRDATGGGVALDEFARAYALAEEGRDRRLAVLASRHAFSCCARAGDLDGAAGWASRSAERDVTSSRATGARDLMAVLELDRGSTARAVDLGVAASEEEPLVRCPYQRLAAVGRLAYVLLRTDQLDDAARWLRELDERSAALGGTTRMYAARLWGCLAADRGEWAEARARFEDAMAHARRAGLTRLADRWLHHWCTARWALRDADGVRDAIDGARRSLGSETDRVYLARLHAFSGLFAARDGKARVARRELERAASVAAQVPSEDARRVVALIDALALRELGDGDGAAAVEAARASGLPARSHVARVLLRQLAT